MENSRKIIQFKNQNVILSIYDLQPTSLIADALNIKTMCTSEFVRLILREKNWGQFPHMCEKFNPAAECENFFIIKHIAGYYYTEGTCSY